MAAVTRTVLNRHFQCLAHLFYEKRLSNSGLAGRFIYLFVSGLLEQYIPTGNIAMAAVVDVCVVA